MFYSSFDKAFTFDRAFTSCEKTTKILVKRKIFKKFFLDSGPTRHALSPPIVRFSR